MGKMNHLRKQILFLCDSLILIVFSTFFSWFSLRYNLTDAQMLQRRVNIRAHQELLKQVKHIMDL